MDLLQEARATINRVDAQMADLFVERMQAAEKVAAYKQLHGMPILDKAREEVVIRNGSARVEDEVLRGYYVDFMRSTMAISRQYQQQLLQNGDGAHILADYNITICRGALSRADAYMNLNRKVLVVTDSGVPAQYAAAVAARCAVPVVVTIDQGEASKNLQNFEMLCRKMLEQDFSRTDCVVAVGGGVVGDLAGFTASRSRRMQT